MTSALLLLLAGVKVTFIFIFTHANVIHREQRFTHKLAFAECCSSGVFTGAMGIYRYLWAVMGFWVSMGFYGCLKVLMGLYGCLWLFMSVYGCLWVSVGVYGCL